MKNAQVSAGFVKPFTPKILQILFCKFCKQCLQAWPSNQMGGSEGLVFDREAMDVGLCQAAASWCSFWFPGICPFRRVRSNSNSTSWWDRWNHFGPANVRNMSQMCFTQSGMPGSFCVSIALQRPFFFFGRQNSLSQIHIWNHLESTVAGVALESNPAPHLLPGRVSKRTLFRHHFLLDFRLDTLDTVQKRVSRLSHTNTWAQVKSKGSSCSSDAEGFLL